VNVNPARERSTGALDLQAPVLVTPATGGFFNGLESSETLYGTYTPRCQAERGENWFR